MPSTELILDDVKVFRHGEPLRVHAAVAVGSGKILAVGPGPQVASLAGPDTQVIDLGGRVVLPGFCDSHVHLASFGHNLQRINLAGTRSLEEALQKVKDELHRFEGRSWILGRGWDKNVWGEEFPTRRALDSVTGGKPAAFSSRCGHILWANTAALAAAGITRETPDLPHGEIERDGDGSPTGILKEAAVRLVKDVRPKPDLAAEKKAILDAVREAHKLGVTSVVTMAGTQEVTALRELEREGLLALRVGVYFENTEQVLEGTGVRLPLVGEKLSLCGLKLYADGSLGGQTALMFEPYCGSADCGVPVVCGEELAKLVRRATRAGIPCAIHAIGDRAVAEALDTIEATRQINPAVRHRIEHAQLMREMGIGRFARGGVIASMQPVHIFGDIETAERYWGERCRYAFPIGSLIESGARVAFGTDCPIERLDPMLGLFAACAREPEGGGEAWYPDQRISLETAIHCYTAEGAYAAGAEARRGVVAPGMDADLVALRGDFLEMELRELLSTRVEMTVFGGRVVYSRLRG